MILKVYDKSEGCSLICEVNDVNDFAIRKYDKSWVLDVDYFDEGIEQDMSDSMILCKASGDDAWKDLLITRLDEGHFDVMTSSDMLKKISEDLAESFKAEHEKYLEEHAELRCTYLIRDDTGVIEWGGEGFKEAREQLSLIQKSHPYAFFRLWKYNRIKKYYMVMR